MEGTVSPALLFVVALAVTFQFLSTAGGVAGISTCRRCVVELVSLDTPCCLLGVISEC